MKLSSPSVLKRFKESRWWGAIVYVTLWGIFLSMLFIPLYSSGWRFTGWLFDVFSTVWPVALFWAILSLLVARMIRKGEDTPEGSPLTWMHYKYNRLEEAYGWMRGAAIAGLIGLLMFWLSIRHKL